MKTGSPGQYEGYTVDVLDALAEANNFTYSITPEQDGVYGVKDDKGNWNGMMGQLVSKVRTIAPLIFIQCEKICLKKCCYKYKLNVAYSCHVSFLFM